MNIFLLVGIVIFLFYEQYIPKHEKMIVFGCIALALLVNIHDMIGDYTSRPENLHMIGLRTFSSWIGYVTRPILLWGLWELMKGKKNRYIRLLFAILAIGNLLVFSTCFFTDLPFGYKQTTYQWYRGPLGFTAHNVMVTMMVLFIPVLIDMYFNNRKIDFLAGLTYLLSILAATIYDTFWDHKILSDVITYEVILYLLLMHIDLEEEHKKTLIQAQKAEMMLMQIKPHFINNTLGTIQALCEIDPPLAAHTTGNFARYLRTNLSVMDKPLPIPVEEELEHTRTYLEIEVLRFSWVKVEYDIQDTDFCVPALSIQPLAENAVKHGLRKKRKGTLIIRTRKAEKGHIVEVIDDGAGFDQNNLNIEKDHGVGTQNVRFRIEKLSHGTMTIDSTVGEGTTITIFIP